MNSFQYTRVPRLWPGETVVIVGGGPSLRGFDGGRLRGRRVIAVNNAWEIVPADILWFADSRWWRWNGEAVRARFKGIVATRACLEADDIRRADFRPGRFWHLRRSDEDVAGNHGGIALEPDTVRGGMGGHNAINLAVHLGAAKLVLLGFDGKPDEAGRFQYHDRHRAPTSPTLFPERALPDLRSTAAPLAALGIEVINARPDMAVDWWPLRDLESALA